MAKVLISTVYSMDSIVLCATKLSVDRIYLLVDSKPDAVQSKTVKEIESSLGKALEVKTKKISVYDIVSIAKSTAELIDVLPNDDEIFINITPARKTQALGLLFASYSRSLRIKKIFYVVEDSKELIQLPLLSFDVSESQLKILESIEDAKQLTKLADELKISRAMLYRNIKDLKHKGLIEDDNGFKLTDAGKIARL